jgi:positive regulator of sigma E activity
MKQQATATKVNGKWKAKVIRSEACASCRACQFGQQEELLVDLPGKDYQEGQQVELETEGREFTKAALWAYGLPLVGLFGGLFAGSALAGYLPFQSEVSQAGGAILGVALSCVIIRFLDRHIRRSRRYQPQCRQTKQKDHPRDNLS